MTDKTASVHWEGRGKAGQRQISTETQALRAYPCGVASRFQDDRIGTNPEEFLAVAHADRFTTAFSVACNIADVRTGRAGPDARVRLFNVSDGFVIDRIAVTLAADVSGPNAKRVQALVKRDCPLPKALASVPELTLQCTQLGANT
jgi:osmotically inducible protein OsmC